jgi:hypothetical protein
MIEENASHSSKLASCVVEAEESEGDGTIYPREENLLLHRYICNVELNLVGAIVEKTAQHMRVMKGKIISINKSTIGKQTACDCRPYIF